jgi:hypothetical protein
MHYDQNFAKNILKTMIREKDDVKVRHDLQGRSIRPQLWLTTNPRRGGKMLKPAIGFVLSMFEFDSFATTIENLKTPLGHVSNIWGVKVTWLPCSYVTNISSCINRTFSVGFCKVVMRVSKTFRNICSKIWNPSEFESLQTDVAITLALVEMDFAPSFFNIMTQLLYHLVDEIDLCGLVASRWMYPVEWYMKTLKIYVRNMASPKASMVEGYIRDECFGFVIEYLQSFEVVQ